jgi:hypothetical protein
MSSFSAAPRRSTHPAGEDPADSRDHGRHAGRYLTDGVELYRSLGPITPGRSEMIGLENCRSLDIILIAVDELRQRRLRPVIPASVMPSGREV